MNDQKNPSPLSSRGETNLAIDIARSNPNISYRELNEELTKYGDDEPTYEKGYKPSQTSNY